MAGEILNYFPKDMTPRSVQRDLLLELEEKWDANDIFVVTAPTACHARGQQIIKADGTLIAVEDIVEGDELLGPDGTVRTVQETHSGRTNLVKILPKRGDPWTVTHDHILSLHHYKTHGRYNRDKGKTYSAEKINMSVQEYIKQSKTYKHTSKLWKPDAIEFPTESQELQVDPYILGLWLGDGNSASTGLTTMDNPIRDYWLQYGSYLGMDFRCDFQEDNQACTYYLKTPRGQANPLLKSIQYYGLQNNKHIPHCYKTSSITNRLRLLAGLIDTDGYCDPKASIEITQVRKKLAEDILFVVRSLGFSGQIAEKIIKGQSYWRVTFSGQQVSSIPCLIKTPVNSKSNQNHIGFEIEAVGEGDYYGFTVDKDNLYLLSDWTVTHNSGKTAIASTIMRWQGFAAYIVPNNQLLDQASSAVPLAPAIRKRSTYWCSRNRMSCEDVHRADGCTCGDSCTYERALHNASTKQMSISNYHTYLAHRLYKSTLVVDEAHLLVDMLQDLAARRLWRSAYNWPAQARTLGDLVEWLDNRRADGLADDSKLTKLYKELTTLKPSTLVVRTQESLRNSPPQDVLKLIPLDTRNEPPVLWPPHRVRKIVLLSATIGLPDVENMGLSKRRVCYLNCASPIPIANRPIIYEPVGSMSYSSQSSTLPAMVGALEYKMARHRDKGLIHATYTVARRLQSEMGENPRLMFHDQTNKAEVYEQWRSSPPEEGRVLVACGMYEGVDVAYDAGTWQVITKIPFPSLTDPAILAKLREDPTWYDWTTLKMVVQAAGRICRAPDDRGVTYILDSSFQRLLNKDNEREIKLIPEYFREALNVPN